MSDEKKRVLGDYIRAGTLNGQYFKSQVPVNSKQDKYYRVCHSVPLGANDLEFEIVPAYAPNNSSERNSPVSIFLRQHLDDLEVKLNL